MRHHYIPPIPGKLLASTKKVEYADLLLLLPDDLQVGRKGTGQNTAGASTSLADSWLYKALQM